MSDENFSAIKMEDIEDILSHHGVKDMHWGVWNDETKRKYGVLGPKGRKTNVDSPPIPKSDSPKQAKPSLVERGKNAINQKRQAKQDAKEAERKRIADEEAAAIAASKRDSEIRSKYGMSANEYDKLRNVTLNSHDPVVVAKGMKLLSDDELTAKIQRLEQEGRIKSLAETQKKQVSEARRAELQRKQQSLPYRLGESAAKTITGTVVNNITKNTIGPITSAVSKSLGDSGVKALNSLKKHATDEAPKVKSEIESTKATVKQETAVAKAEIQTAKNNAAQRKAKSSKAKSSSTTTVRSPKSEINEAFGRELYSRIKAANNENIEGDSYNYNPLSSSKKDKKDDKE